MEDTKVQRGEEDAKTFAARTGHLVLGLTTLG
jgi:hypothetical protein